MKDKPPRPVAGYNKVGKLCVVTGHWDTDDKNLSITVPSVDKRKTGQTCIADYTDIKWVIDRLIGQGHDATPAPDAAACGALGCRQTDDLVTVHVDDLIRTLCGRHAVMLGDA